MPPIKRPNTQPSGEKPEDTSTPSFLSEKGKAVERLAINLVDLQRLPEEYVKKALQGKIAPFLPIHIDKNREDEIGVEFSTDPSLVICASICDIIRSKDRLEGRYPTRVYIMKRTAWTKLGSDLLLTVEERIKEKDGIMKKVYKLNPEVFNVEIELAPLTAPKVEPVEL